jgi:hypothetical protein
MVHHRQFYFEDLSGQKIKKVLTNHADKVLLIFEDGKFSMIYAYEHDEEFYIEDGEFYIDEWDSHIDELIELNVITQSQYDQFKNKLIEREEKRKAARKAEYERLKAEFEP